jgi:hypothetical protein
MAILSTRKFAKWPPRLQSGASIPNDCNARRNRRQSVQLSIDFDEINIRLVHAKSGLRLPGQFSFSEISEIFFRSLEWDWTIDDNHRPACAQQLLALLEETIGKESGDQTVRAIGEVEEVGDGV